MRFDDESNKTELIDQYITADQAIEALLFVQGLEPIEEETGDDAEEEADVQVDDEPEVPEVPAPKPDAPKGRRASYDKAELEADVRANLLSTKEIADKHNVPTATVYQVRSALKHADPVAVSDDAPATTAYAIRQKERAAIPEPDTNIEGEIKLAAMQGFSVSEIADMYPTVPLGRIAALKAEAALA